MLSAQRTTSMQVLREFITTPAVTTVTIQTLAAMDKRGKGGAQIATAVHVVLQLGAEWTSTTSTVGIARRNQYVAISVNTRTGLVIAGSGWIVLLGVAGKSPINMLGVVDKLCNSVVMVHASSLMKIRTPVLRIVAT